jgi:hypothetical protein
MDTEMVRSLVDEIVMVPEAGQLRIKVRGALAAILSISGPASAKAPALPLRLWYRKSRWLRGQQPTRADSNPGRLLIVGCGDPRSTPPSFDRDHLAVREWVTGIPRDL